MHTNKKINVWNEYIDWENVCKKRGEGQNFWKNMLLGVGKRHVRKLGSGRLQRDCREVVIGFGVGTLLREQFQQDGKRNQTCRG